MPSAWLATVGVAAAAISVATALPQVWRLRRSPTADGLSPAAVVLGVLATLTWLVYGALQADPPQVVANVPGLAGAAAITALVVRRTATRPDGVLAAVGGWCLLLAAAWSAGGAFAVGCLGTVVSLVARAPQVVEVFRSRSLDGVSPASFALGCAAATLWAVYGVGTAQTPVWSCSVVVAAMSAVICLRSATSRRPVAVASGRQTIFTTMSRSTSPALATRSAASDRCR
jgi:uncharacterized protein with PQ loop repeat